MAPTKTVPYEPPAPGVEIAVKVIDQTGMEHMTVIDNPSITAAVRQEMAVGVFCSGIAKPWPDDAVSTETIPKPARHSRGIAVASVQQSPDLGHRQWDQPFPSHRPPFA